MKQGGALQVSYSILNELKNFPENEYHVFLSPQLDKIVDRQNFPANFNFYSFTINPTASIKVALTYHQKLSALEEKIKPDFVFTVFGPALWRPRASHLVGFANGVLFVKNRYSKFNLISLFNHVKFNIRRALIMRQLRREADLVWVETEYAKQKLKPEIHLSLKEIFVVGNTYSRYFEQATNEFKPYDGASGEPFKFIYLTSYYAHKNIEILNKVIPLLHRDNVNCQFYLTLPNDVYEQIFPELKKDPMLVNMGPVSPFEAPQTYNKVDALFMPSLLELFSASYPEAMKMHKPIITSDLDFAHSICGDAALYMDPYSPESIVEKIKELISSPQLQQHLVVAGNKRLQRFDSAYTRVQKLLAIMHNHLDS